MEKIKKTWEEMTAREAAQALADRRSLRQRSYQKAEASHASDAELKYGAMMRKRDEEYHRKWSAAELKKRAMARFVQLMGEKKPSARYAYLIDCFASYFARENGLLKPAKGIILSGCTGCGKTTLFKIFNFNFVWACDQPAVQLSDHNALLFSWNSCRGIAMEYTDKERGGIACLKKYFGVPYRVPSLFDDLGAENIGIHYGTKADVMGEIIQSRYDDGARTFFTTNLTYEQIQQTYGERVASRLAEMCNWVDMQINEDYRR